MPFLKNAFTDFILINFSGLISCLWKPMIDNSGLGQTQWARHCANFPARLCQSISVWTTFTLESGAGWLCDSWGTWRGFFITRKNFPLECQGLAWSCIFPWCHSWLLALVATGEPGWELCAWLPWKHRGDHNPCLWRGAETTGPE